jgi:hypothetical protein
MTQFATVHISFWPIVFDDSPDTVDMEVIEETNETITCRKYPNDNETVTIRKNDTCLVAVFAKE